MKKIINKTTIPLRRPSQEEVTHFAAQLWQTRGCPIGCDLAIWLEAERALAEHIRVGADDSEEFAEKVKSRILDLGIPPDRRSPTSL